MIDIHSLEFSSLGSSRCKYVCPRALAVPPAPNRGPQGDSDYFHKRVNLTILAVIIKAAIRVWRRTQWHCWHRHTRNTPMDNRFESIWFPSCGRGWWIQIIVLFSKKTWIFSSYNLFPPVLLFTLIVFKKTRKAKFQTKICLLATLSGPVVGRPVLVVGPWLRAWYTPTHPTLHYTQYICCILHAV